MLCKCSHACRSSGLFRFSRMLVLIVVRSIMRRLREHEYNPALMKLYVVGGGGCLIRNFTEFDPSRVTINDDICATAKGYERLAERKLDGKA